MTTTQQPSIYTAAHVLTDALNALEQVHSTRPEVIEALVDNIHRHAMDYVTATDKVVRLAGDLEDTAARVRRSLSMGWSLSSNGELQSVGPAFDKACTDSTAAASAVTAAAWTLRQALGNHQSVADAVSAYTELVFTPRTFD